MTFAVYDFAEIAKHARLLNGGDSHYGKPVEPVEPVEAAEPAPAVLEDQPYYAGEFDGA